MGLNKIENEYRGKRSYTVLYVAVIIGGCLLASLLRTDYNYAGVLMILSFYLFRYNKVLLTVALVIIYEFALGGIQILAVFALIPIWFYNGQRGKKMNKYLFYSFYPVHILLLYFISIYLIK